jgi:acylphosphatase
MGTPVTIYRQKQADFIGRLYNSAFLAMRVARRFVVSGRVQGVGFRYFAQDAALREGVTGWVCNRPDGTVEALVEGDEEAVTRFERSFRSGPRGSRVDNVYADTEEPSGAYRTFSIRH